jgi:pentapeptide repeat protein
MGGRSARHGSTCPTRTHADDSASWRLRSKHTVHNSQEPSILRSDPHAGVILVAVQAGARCSETDCPGYVGEGLTACLAHLDDAGRSAYLGEVRCGRELDARGVQISAALFDQATEHLRSRPRGSSTFLDKMLAQRYPPGNAGPGVFRFDGAVFEAGVTLDTLVFPALASFAEARFLGDMSAAAEFRADVSFEGVIFDKIADFTDALIQGRATFERAEFQQAARFTGAKFEAEAIFKQARFFAETTFSNDVDYDGTQFHAGADFSGAQFKGPLHCAQLSGSEEGDSRFDATDAPLFAGWTTFNGCAFESIAVFDRAHFGNIVFQNATFADSASFAEASFSRSANFDGISCAALRMHGANFSNIASFASARVEGLLELADVKCASDLVFNEAILGGRIDVTLLHVTGRAWFIRCQFERARDFGPIAAYDKLDLDHATFNENVRIEVATPRLLCRKTNFRGGVYLLVRWAQVSLEEAGFGGPAVLVGAPSEFDQLDEEPLYNPDRTDGRPSLMSVRRANVANLTVANVDLRPTRFAQAQNLDKMRLGDPVQLAETPERIWWSARSTTAEEQLWRSSHYDGRRRSGWYPDTCQIPQWVNDEIAAEAGEPIPAPQELASTYRQLRKGREDSKDEPGAADFYYGEMEMRRKAPIPSGARLSKTLSLYAEHALLWTYWAISGYGLRASRALVSLVLTILLFSLALLAWGFPHSHSYSYALLYSAQSVTSLLRAPTVSLTAAGEWLSIGLRLLGPLFFGLILLSLRGRVRR